ncbi:Na+/H+ antiporter subunit E [Prauserella cavernicola]|uniref:Na+/H+ antiporter subunit E n=1 Tax=Prauserella cavernicola TaxID=2800127 RepID=A0A934V889_9PSEU|nr:Na+/H+ antiporter subunit E [Prauserella cavernicola]MBK1788050.1 Na+/H+ antiporter subunit E [Prauserella cavernicola]
MRRLSPSLLVWLVLVWVSLWGTLDVTTVVFGVLVALGVLVFFPLPVHRWNIFGHPLRLASLTLYVVWDLVLSAVRLAWDEFRHGSSVKAAIVAVPVLSDVDHVIASASNVLSLGPGRFVLQIDRANRIWYVYALGVRSRLACDKIHDDALDLQVRVIHAFGAPDEARTVRERAEEAKRRRARAVDDGTPRETEAP